ncbi:neuroblastoma suppressor of tumorigenicity 1-like [Oratosquilla oratoria]|uniref:neuroblastoma suppressor of tumorigenicity 1-like n=1 Tax=Oratosquilla oratoria TaxID=337810 RepID=UPI003F7753E6
MRHAMAALVWAWLALAGGVALALQDPEAPDQVLHHKVHNLDLYPEQHSWCELKHIRQIVTHQQCKSLEMENFVCVGTCFSYSVPQTEPETPGDEMLDYCDSCQASEAYWTTVVLDCENEGTPYKVTKSIQMIQNCSCSPCRPNRGYLLDNDVIASRHNDKPVPELLFKMLPDKMKEPSPEQPGKDLEYRKISLAELKKEFSSDPNLDSRIDMLVAGKSLFKDFGSFNEENESE